MHPAEVEVRRLVGDWVQKAELDFKAVLRLSAESEFREIVTFHAQQTAEKYLKALLILAWRNSMEGGEIEGWKGGRPLGTAGWGWSELICAGCHWI